MGSAARPNATFRDGRRDDYRQMVKEDKLSPGATPNTWSCQSGRSRITWSVSMCTRRAGAIDEGLSKANNGTCCAAPIRLRSKCGGVRKSR